ncbi:ester cyclase [Lysobacter korlensis]|uniref:Ester cyclase n=1 Tax=Lysobacter korlensis TaxID=553636 RepID=A0ABV6RTL6_9GAMM
MRTPEETVSEFFRVVRSGDRPELAREYLAPAVLAHQVRADSPDTIQRDPDGYTEHVRDMVATYGPFSLTIDEFIADGDKVYVRWTQTGWHRAPVDGFAPTGRPLRTVASAVYRVTGGMITEYWMQQEDSGLRAQLLAHRDEPGV